VVGSSAAANPMNLCETQPRKWPPLLWNASPYTRNVRISLPQKQSEVFFCLLTDAGIFTASVSKEDLASHRHPLSKLHDAAQGIIAEYRLIQGNK
jgi:hypothetical protein